MQTQIPALTECVVVRQLVDNLFVDNERYGGITDAEGLRAYIRLIEPMIEYAPDNHTTSSCTPNSFMASAKIRIVIMDNAIDEYMMMDAIFNAASTWLLSNCKTIANGQVMPLLLQPFLSHLNSAKIYEAETGNSARGALKMAAVDFRLDYRIIIDECKQKLCVTTIPNC